ncbi:thermonuclease family protein [Phyllobacterium sophorae]|uniref:Succinoglycan biosynthesis protein exoi n=1 Tax=Phyllobacterium sophorae TaxID=1520277 RepID=A0A2P7AQJ7_9HYPH|nr:succinoglycan biosynthesis protein exoi [Phyllobacterium sophorae]PSH56508.1 succinoglycan biosynthesis protein exoi [Phyllobacterium sophorae]
MRSIAIISSGIIALYSTIGAAQQTDQSRPQPAARVFSIPQTGLSFLTGDTWQQGTQKLRLYGVQACIRGTLYTDHSGIKQDCGTVSLAMLAATIRDTKPTCSPIAQLPSTTPQEPATILVICSAHVGDKSLDLGTVLITEGFAFAAFSNGAKPVYMPYLVAEATAKQSRAGLWAFPDMPHPNLVLFQAMQSKTQKP